MKILLALMVAFLALLPPAAEARDWPFGGARMQSQGQPPKGGPGQPPRGERPRPPDSDKRTPPGRLSREERRELDRDLDRANREIYRR